MNKYLVLGFTALLLISANLAGQTVFKTVVLGSGGGIEENNLSAYLLAHKNSNHYICMDAGTVYTGIEQAVRLGNFYDVFVPSGDESSKTGYVFRELIKGYLITHAHLDHIAGLVIASPASKKNFIYADASTIGFLKQNIFNWETWPNFTNEGKGMHLNVFDYRPMVPGKKTPIEGTGMSAAIYPLSHQEPYTSSAFLIEHAGHFVLYAGDTGADEVEGTDHLDSLWHVVAPIIREDRLHAIFLECSWPDAQPDEKLYGHLSPKWVIRELTELAGIVDENDPGNALAGLPVIITGIKPGWKEGEDNKYMIYKQLLQKNKTGVKFIIPEQGQLIEF